MKTQPILKPQSASEPNLGVMSTNTELRRFSTLMTKALKPATWARIQQPHIMVRPIKMLKEIRNLNPTIP